MSKKAVIRQNLFSGIFFITKKLAYEKKNKKNKHHFLSENCSTFFTRKFRAIKKILILVISIEAHLPTVRRSVGESVCWSVGQLVGWLVGWWVGRFV